MKKDTTVIMLSTSIINSMRYLAYFQHVNAATIKNKTAIVIFLNVLAKLSHSRQSRSFYEAVALLS